MRSSTSILNFMRKPLFRVPTVIFLAILILVAPVKQQRTEAEPTTAAILLTPLLFCAGAFAAFEGIRYSVDCWIFHGDNWNWYDFAGHVTAGALQGMAMFLVWTFPPSVLMNVLGCAATVQGVAGALGDIIGDFFEWCVSDITSAGEALFSAIKNNITAQSAEFSNRFLPTLEALCNANGSVPSDSSFDPIWADFSNAAIENSNITINTVGMEYNSYEGRSWRMLNPGTSNLQATFNLSQVPSGVILSLTHLSSADSGAPGGGYSPVDIYINGYLFSDNYDVAQHHCGSHGYETDQWQIEQYLVSGQNTITISFEDNPWAYTHYWIQSLAVTCGSLGTAIPNYTVTALASAHGLIEPSGNICPAAGDSKTFYATPDSGYVVDKWYVNGQAVSGSEGLGTFTLYNIQQDKTVLVTFKSAPPAGSITVTAPIAGQYARGKTVHIGWNAPNVAGNVKIELYKGSTFDSTIEDSILASYGTESWQIQNDLELRNDYRIKISALSSSEAGYSNYFEVIAVVDNGTPIPIHNVQELQQIASEQVVNGRVFSRDGYYVLANPINASGFNFVPIGTPSTYFRGTFDGQGFSISDLTITQEAMDEVGLFRYTGDKTVIKNLILNGGNIRGKSSVGAIAGLFSGMLINCHSSARVWGTQLDTSYNIGGLVGDNYQGEIRNCSTFGTATIRGYGDGAGGIAGENESFGKIYWCWTTASDVRVYDTGTSATVNDAGGIAGENDGEIVECYSTLSSNIRSYDNFAGGIAGDNASSGIIHNCYSNNTINGSHIGGIVGKEDGSVTNSYATGFVSSSGGGLFGNYSGVADNCFWDTQTTGKTACAYYGTCPATCYGKITAEMKQMNTFSSAGWDFDNVWSIDEGVDYPRLRGAKPCLAAPTGIIASNGQPGKITITWNSVADAGAYRVYRSDFSDGVFNPITSWFSGSSSYQDGNGVIADVSYYYKVKAAYTINGAGESEFSNSDEGMCIFQLPCPTNVTATTDLRDFVLVQWDSVAGAGYYRVYRSESQTGSKTAISGWADGLSFVDTFGIPGVSYYYWVTASADSSGTGQSDFAGPAIGATPNPDVTSDGKVDFVDYAVLANQWLVTGCQQTNNWCNKADIDKSGEVDYADLLIMAQHWLKGTDATNIRGINMDFVSIGNAGNATDPATGSLYGAVGYNYHIGKYEVTNAQWNTFTAVAGAPTGNDGGYGQSAYFTGAQQPTNNVSWYEAAQFCNYLTSGDKSKGAYQFSGNNANPGYFQGINRTAAQTTYGTIYVIPTENEWYKAAYHKNDGVTGNYWLYPTQSNNVPSNDLINPDPGNNANFYQDDYTIGDPDYLTAVGEFENSDSAYGTFDQGGNVWEWNETLSSGSYRGLRGGSCQGYPGAVGLSSSYRYDGPSSAEFWQIGFRVCRNVEPSDMVWVDINDPGVSGHKGFTGYMSKYETTNAQYCQFLNAAKAGGLITVYTDNVVYATSDTSHSQPYYDLAGPGCTDNGATNGGAARIHYTGSSFTVDSGFENHPVTYVTWYGATAFCNYYGYRLPTEWEWQAVADYDGSYTYGCGTTINNSIANQYGSTHPYGTTVVGSFGDPSGYGYGMCDMAGNVHEWTSTGSGSCVFRGGCWVNIDYYCTVSFQYSSVPDYTDCHYGFRVCR